MEETIYNLGDVSKLLGVKPHLITYALASGGVPEPKLRLGNRRVFTLDDVHRLAAHLQVGVVGADGEQHEVASVGKAMQGETPRRCDPAAGGTLLNSPFCVMQIGEACHEVRDGLGEVIAWTPDRAKAMVIAGLLEHAGH